MKKRMLLLALLTAACSGQREEAQTLADQAGAPAQEMSEEQRIAMESIRAASEKYADPGAALADGFMRDPHGMCITATDVGLPPELGAMGVHYIQPVRLGLAEPGARLDGADGIIDWAQPEVLVYEPQADGSEKLVAVEYLVFQKAWHDAGNTAPPEFFGTAFISMADDPNTEPDEAHEFMPHYELHVWSARENPTGMYAEFNPAVNCQLMTAAHASH
jgi:hypothetical protein